MVSWFRIVLTCLSLLGAWLDLRLLPIYLHYLRASLGSLATVLAPSGTRPRFTTPYRRHAPPVPQ
jgi:hypothetical protein